MNFYSYCRHKFTTPMFMHIFLGLRHLCLTVHGQLTKLTTETLKASKLLLVIFVSGGGGKLWPQNPLLTSSDLEIGLIDILTIILA